MSFTAGEIVEDALRHLTVLDAVEVPTDTQMLQGVKVLNNLMQHEFGDVMSSFQTKRVDFSLAKGKASFTIGEGKDIPNNARKVHEIYYGSFGNTKYRLENKSETHIFAVGVQGPNPVKYLQEMSADGSLLITIWPTPSGNVPLALSMGIRVGKITKGTDVILIPDDAAYFLSFILASRLRPNFGVPIMDVQDVITLGDRKAAEWKGHSVKNTSVRLRRSK